MFPSLKTVPALPFRLSFVLLVLMLTLSSPTVFAGQVIINAIKDYQALKDGIISIENERYFLSGTGSAVFELDPGVHQLVLQQYGQELVQLTLELTETENQADISIVLNEGEEAQITSKRFSASDDKAKQVGIISGYVTSKQSGEAIAKAVITLSGSDVSTTSAEDGSYELRINRGQYELNIAAPGFASSKIKDIGVTADSFVEFNVGLADEGAEDIEEVVAIGSYIADTVTADKRDSSAILDVIGSEQLSRFGDSSAASALKRVAGVSVNDGKFAVVRGLNERYTAVTLNGATLPSPDPTRRVVPLDIFPSAILSQIDISKTNSADLPSDSTGAVIQMKTSKFSGERNRKLNLSLGHTSDVTMSSLYTYEGGERDFLGMDDGTRSLPDLVASSTKDFSNNNLSDEEIQNIGRSFPNNYNLERDKALPNMSIEYSMEDTKAIENSDKEWAYLAAVKYKNSWEREMGQRRTFAFGGGELVEDDSYLYDRGTNNIDLSAAFSAILYLDTAHSIGTNTMLLRQSEANATFRRGIIGDNDRDVKASFLGWEEKQFLIQQFYGEHNFYNEYDLRAKWRVGVSSAELDSPDNRAYNYEEVEDKGFVLFDSSIEREYVTLKDDNIDFGGSLEGLLTSTNTWQLRGSAGLEYFDRERTSQIERFGFRDKSNSNASRTEPNLENILVPNNIKPDEFVILYQTLPSDSYIGEWQYNATYGKLNFEYFDLYKVEAGARFEDSLQTLNTANFDGFPTETELDDSGVLPSVNLTWFTRENMQTRFGFSQTKNRPDFREISESIFYHPDTRDQYRGNKNLEIAEIDNFDIRGEWYFSDRESVSLAFFLKDFINPIEETARPVSGGGGDRVIFSFENQESARVQGIEIDFKKEKEFSQGLAFVSGNMSLIDSEVTLFKADVSGNTERAMQGQPENLANLQLGFDHYASAWEYTLVMNRTGASLQAVGQQSLPNIDLESRLQLDVNARKQIKDNLNVKVAINNVSDSPVEYTQGGEKIRSFKKGRELSASMSYSF